jgi:hypothetical protein
MKKDNKQISKSIQIVNNYKHYNENIDKFEHEVYFHVEEIIKSIWLTTNILNMYHKEK